MHSRPILEIELVHVVIQLEDKIGQNLTATQKIIVYIFEDIFLDVIIIYF